MYLKTEVLEPSIKLTAQLNQRSLRETLLTFCFNSILEFIFFYETKYVGFFSENELIFFSVLD